MERIENRIAFIIQCHKNPEQINLLTDVLNKIYNCRVFLHLDKKCEYIRPQINNEQCTLLSEEKSIDVRWGTFSQCEASLALIDAVLSSEDKFDYVWLISGQDFPIVNKEKAAHFFPENPEPFIDVIGSDHSAYQRFAKRNNIYYPEWLMHRKTICRIIRKVLQYITGGLSYTLPIFRRKFCAPFYFGSSWWCLPYDCVKEMREILNGNQNYLRYFKNTINSDESFFQTLFMQTSYSGRQRKILTYIDWSQGASSPMTFTASHWDSLSSAGEHYLFARKFDFTTDKNVCYRILEELCGIQPHQ